MTAPNIESKHLPELQAALEHINAGRRSDATQILERILQSDADNHNALQLLGGLLIDGKQREAGIAYLQRSLAIKPGMPSVLNNLGCALFDDGDFEKAAEFFRQTAAIWTDRPS